MNFETLIRMHFPEFSHENHRSIDFSNADIATLIGLGGAESVTSLNKLMAWPLDIFLVLHSLVDFTDKYRMIVSPESSSWNKSDLTEGIELYKDWLTHLDYMRDANKPKITSQSNLIKHLKVIFKK
ncbi:hypothetical protein D0815_24645, partial [Vibrio parahaemolyticus]|nr:hypothetical protein [Vibrio parahaemolyticus]